MPRTGAIGHSQIGRHPDQADVDILKALSEGRPHERGNLGISRLQHGVTIRIAFRLVSHSLLLDQTPPCHHRRP
jgi:hypothetical protein